MAGAEDDSSSEEEDERNVYVEHIVTVDEMLIAGLILRFTQERIDRAKKATNIKRFAEKFGVMPLTACRVYQDLQRDKFLENATEVDLRFFLIALNYLATYPKMHDVESNFDYSRGYISEIIWKNVQLIQSLKSSKIVFPDDFGLDIWVMSVDGTHSWTQERAHEEFSRNRDRYTHKFNHAGLAYELGISLTGGLIWMNGPFDPGKYPDLRIFRNGLKQKLIEAEKKAIGDRGYRGEPDLISTYNDRDSKTIAMFKSRALLRHENFNSIMKTFDILSERFRHSDDQFKSAFEAVAVLAQYKIEQETPLFDILVQAVFDAE